MPRPIAPPYSNVQANIKHDYAKHQRFSFANASFLNIHAKRKSEAFKTVDARSPSGLAHESSGGMSPVSHSRKSQISSKKRESLPAVMATRWNQNLQNASSDHTSPLARMNVGTSYFVAAANITHKPEIVKVVEANQELVKSDLNRILERFAEEEEEKTKHMSEEVLALRKSIKPAGIRKVEALIDRINQNKTGVLVNGRNIRKPSESVAMRLAQQSPGKLAAQSMNSELPDE